MRSKRLLFLTLSGVRVREPELRRLGMTLPGFIERGRTIAQLPSLGLLTLAGMTPDDWAVDYQELDTIDESALRQLCASDATMVAISALTARILEAYAVADRLRRAGKLVVLGGLHVSALPAEAADHADCVIVGEGESIWHILLEDYCHGRLKDVYRSRDYYPHGFPFAQSPQPRYELLDPSRYNRLLIQTTRGCPLDCEFCGASRLISPYKRKPLERIRREIEHILTIWDSPFIELADDNTFLHRGWSRELAGLLVEYPIRWFTETDISVADDESLLALLAESGCAQLLIGLESAAANSLRGIDRRDWKRRRFETYRQSIQRIHEFGISVNGCFTLGLDDDTLDIFEQTRDYVRALGLSEVQITILTPFPGTELYQRFERDGRLLRPRAWDEYTLFDVTYQPNRMSVDELKSGFAWLMGELYNDEATAKRKRLFRAIRRQRRERFPRRSRTYSS